MSRDTGPTVAMRYTCAVVSIALAILVRHFLDPLIGEQFPFVIVFFAVLVTAWYGGFLPALTATLLGAVATDYFVMSPRWTLELNSLDQAVGLAAYVATGVGISILGGSMHAARRRAEATTAAVLRQAALIDQIHDAVLVWDWNGAITFWNLGAERLYGFSSNDAVGRVSHDLLRTSRSDGMAALIESLERDGSWEGELIHTSRDGQAIVVESRMVLIRDADRAYVLETNHNVTARNAAEQELREANELLEARVGKRTAQLAESTASLQEHEAKFRSYIQNAPIAVLVADGNARFVDCNPAAVDLLGYELTELVGMSVTDIHAEEDMDEILGTMASLVREGRVEGEFQMKRRDGCMIWAALRAVVLENGESMAFCTDVTDRRKIDADLRDAKDRLAFALQHSHTGGWDLNLVDHTAVRTLEHDRIFGYESLLPEWTFEMFLEHVVPEDRAHVQRLFSEAVATQTDWSFECRIRRVDGEVRWIWAAGGHHVDGTGGAPMRMAGIVQDITPYKQAEEAARASEERYRLLVEGVSDHAIFMLDPAGKILTWSPGSERIDGYAADEIIGEHYSCLFTPEGNATDLPGQEMALAAAAGKAEIDGWRVRKNGSRYWANGTLAALYGNNGAVQGFTTVKRDLTAKRRNDEILRSVLDYALDGIISIDQNGIITMINRAGEVIFDRPASEVIGQNVSMLMPEPFSTEHDGYLARYLATGEARIIGTGREVRALRKDGSTFEAELAVTEFTLENDHHFVGIVRDVSDKKRLQEQLHQSQKMEAFGQLAGGVAHDFNNLLLLITGYSDMLLRNLAPDDAKRKMVDEIRHAGDRAASLTRQLLAFSRQQVLAPRILDINTIVTDTGRMLQRLIGEDLDLVTTLQPNIRAVKADPGQVEQVIMNLAVNARDAMPEGGTLTIETGDVEFDESHATAHPDTRPGRFVMVAISDTGCGMAPDVAARVFEPFFTTKEVGKGTGLGLAVVHGIVAQTGGSIEVTSEVGVGTAFRIYLPAVDGKPAAAADAVHVQPQKGSETILLVEDDYGVRKLVALALEGAGYTVLSASGGKAALQLMENRTGVDLLVTDVVMPEMNGRKLAETMRGLYPDLKVLFLSGYTDDAVVRHGVMQSDVPFLQKPFTPSSLATKVREVLDRV